MEYSNTHTHTENLIDNEEKERLKKYHRTRFIIYLCLWFFAGWPLIIFSTVLGAIIGGTQGAVIFLGLGVIAVITFLILWIYHLIKWLNV